MANQPPPSNFLSNSFVAVLLTLAGAIYLARQAPLEGARPLQTDLQTQRSFAPEMVELRLWQDPFAGIADSSLAKGDGDKTGYPSPCESVENPLPTNKLTSVIGVMLPGAPYFETGERRRRTRYAVASALAEDEFFKEFSDRIGCWGIYNIPFETFVNAQSKRIVVLWLNEDTLGREGVKFNHAQGATHLEGGLLGGLAKVIQDLGTAPLKIIGPYSSDALVTMIRDSKREPRPLYLKYFESKTIAAYDKSCLSKSARLQWEPLIQTLRKIPSGLGYPPRYADRQSETNTFCAVNHDLHYIVPPKPLQSVSFYNYGATIAPDLLKKHLEDLMDNDNKPFESAATFLEKQVGLNLYDPIANDSNLADAILGELEKRSVMPLKDGRHIALISEWDTIYGRELPKAIARKLDPNCPEKCDSIHMRTYVRGLDGNLSKAPASEPASTKPNKSSAEDRDLSKQREAAEAFDRPYGLGQQDYLRRLARSLKRQEGGYGPTSHIAAIGVLGSDVFDKLLVLRALKPEFPDALFFTTDLDLSLTLPSERDWTRNLVVASSFGPELHPKIQGRSPPFRDNYQTSAFFATRLAVLELESGCKLDPSKIQENLKDSLKARLFELDRHGELVAFKHNDAKPLSFDCHSRNFDPLPIHPPYTSETPKHLYLIGLALLAPAIIAFAVRTLNWLNRAKGRLSLAPYRTGPNITEEFKASILLIIVVGFLLLTPLQPWVRWYIPPICLEVMGAILWLVLVLRPLVVLEIRRNPGIFDFTPPIRVRTH